MCGADVKRISLPACHSRHPCAAAFSSCSRSWPAGAASGVFLAGACMKLWTVGMAGGRVAIGGGSVSICMLGMLDVRH